MNLTRKQTWQLILAILAGHIMFFAMQVPRAYAPRADRGGPYTWEWILLGRMGLYSLVGALVTPIILVAGYRLRIHRHNLFRNLGLHLLLAVVVGFISYVVYHLGLITGHHTGLMTFGGGQIELYYANRLKWYFFLIELPPLIAHYAIIIAIQQAYLYFKESQERALLLRESELQLLRMQLHPHFFFNTLNAIAALTHRAPQEASRLIARLGDMLRITLQKDKAQEVPLKEEVEFLEAFLHIHKTLMGRRLQVNWQIDPEVLDALVPNMLLQPLVENAIQHGLGPLEAGGTVSISARRDGSNLVLEVSDNGRGLTDVQAATGDGIGLSNTRARLANLYNESHEISLLENAEGGATARIRLPFRELSAEDRDEDRAILVDKVELAREPSTG